MKWGVYTHFTGCSVQEGTIGAQEMQSQPLRFMQKGLRGSRQTLVCGEFVKLNSCTGLLVPPSEMARLSSPLKNHGI